MTDDEGGTLVYDESEHFSEMEVVAQLEVERKDGSRYFIDLTPKGVWTIGKAAHCAIVIDDEGVSTHHATISADNKDAPPYIFMLTDNKSTNGTKIGSTKLAPHTSTEMPVGVAVYLCKTKLTLRQTAGLSDGNGTPPMETPVEPGTPVLGADEEDAAHPGTEEGVVGGGPGGRLGGGPGGGGEVDDGSQELPVGEVGEVSR
mmetsp:Transcript_24297/g.57556  ORF Transcript_24297/g.57556 Transcript_24297/m.57556 type:complete len:202 (-) Transcript_24297:17-622(-)